MRAYRCVCHAMAHAFVYNGPLSLSSSSQPHTPGVKVFFPACPLSVANPLPTTTTGGGHLL